MDIDNRIFAEPSRIAPVKQKLWIGVFILISVALNNVLWAQDYLKQFEEVMTREYVDTSLGFSLAYPYEWNPSKNPLAESDFYVGAPFAMPSFWVNVAPQPEDIRLVDSLSQIDQSRFPNHQGISAKRTTFNGHEAMITVIHWTTADAGRHFVETTMISFYSNERWYRLTLNQSYRETRWSKRLQALLHSFRVLHSES